MKPHITSLLYVISFLDSICYGLIMPVLPIQILILGGNHTILGFHAMLHISFQLFSAPLSTFLNNYLGKKLNLKLSLLLGVITSILMGIYPSYTIIIILRGVYYLTNQTQCAIKAFNLDQNAILNILGIFGFILGPILGGYIFETATGFYLLSLLTGSFYLISLILSGFLPSTPEKDSKISLKNIIYETFQPLSNIQLKNIFLLRFLITFGLTVFFTKFPVLLKVHYLSSHSQVGWTIAYQNFVLLLCSFSLKIFEKKLTVKNFHKLRRFLSVLAISSTAICFAPTYEMYLIGFVFMALSKVLVDSAWKEIEDNFKIDNLVGDLKTVNTLSSVIAPVILGVLCDIYLQNAVKMLTIIPLVIASVLGSYYYVGSVDVAQKGVNKKEKKEK
nr:major facilitator superfamily domain-containing protein 9-like [Onthophagus taurus]